MRNKEILNKGLINKETLNTYQKRLKQKEEELSVLKSKTLKEIKNNPKFTNLLLGI